MKFDPFTWGPRLDVFLKSCVPYVALLLCVLADIVSFDIPTYQNIRPSFSLMGLFYWSIFRPSVVPVWLAFLIGIVLDVMSGYPAGMNALFFSIILLVLGDQRRIFLRQSFLTVYLGFALVLVLFYGGQWLIFSGIAGTFLPFSPALGAMALSLLFFPVVSLVMNMCHKISPDHTQDIIRSAFSKSGKIR
jgi:rod shape-determining protein MreD